MSEWSDFVADLDRREPKTERVNRQPSKSEPRKYERRTGLMVCRYCSNMFSSSNRPSCIAFTGPRLGVTENLP